MNLCFIWKNFTNVGHRNDHCWVQNDQITVFIFITATLIYTWELPESSFLAAIANCASTDDRWRQCSVHTQTAKDRWIPICRSNFRCMTARWLRSDTEKKISTFRQRWYVWSALQGGKSLAVNRTQLEPRAATSEDFLYMLGTATMLRRTLKLPENQS